MVRLVTLMPFGADMNLGAAYNRDMALVPDDAWAVLLDHDMQWTTKRWYAQIQEAIATKPDAGAFTVCTNRIAAPWQGVGDRTFITQERGPDGKLYPLTQAYKTCHDMEQHYKLGEQLANERRTLLDITDTKGFGGVVTVVSKAAWAQVGGYADGLLCVDHSLFFKLRAAGLRSYLMEHVYVYHRRRAFGAELPKDTPIAAGCPCRGNEPTPTVRIPLESL